MIIHCLHICDNFDTFNTNIEDFVGKNSEQITKYYPSISYFKVKTPKSWIGHTFGTDLNFDIP